MTKYHVYSSMLGGYLAMDFTTREEAQEYINDYHCKIEKTGMKVLTQENRK